MPLDVVCGLACGLATGLGAAMVRAEVTPGSSVLVVGAGGVGLATMMGARFAGATTVVAVDRLATKIEKALELGLATHGVDASTGDDPVAAVLEVTGGRGADYGFDAAGVPGTLDLVLAATRPGATCVVIGRVARRGRRHRRHDGVAARSACSPAPTAGPSTRAGTCPSWSTSSWRGASTSAPSSTGVTRSTTSPRRSTTSTTAG